MNQSSKTQNQHNRILVANETVKLLQNCNSWLKVHDLCLIGLKLKDI